MDTLRNWPARPGVNYVIASRSALYRTGRRVESVFSAAHFETQIVGERLGIRELQKRHPPVLDAKACRELPVFAFDVGGRWLSPAKEASTARRGQCLGRSAPGEAQHMLRPIASEMVAIEFARPRVLSPLDDNPVAVRRYNQRKDLRRKHRAAIDGVAR